MKQKGIQAIAAGMVLLLLMTGCGSQSKEAVQQSDDTEQYVSTELPEEGSSDSSVESLVNDSKDSTDEETQSEDISVSISEMSVAERIKTLTVEGAPLTLPCKVEDMEDGFSLGEGVTAPTGTTLCKLFYNGKEVGKVDLPEVTVATDHFVDMSTGYEGEWVNTYTTHTDQGYFEILGITPESTMEDVINLWGDPDTKTDMQLKYRDINPDTGESIAFILYLFDLKGNMLYACFEIVWREME